jgi:hypothetical protein
MFFSLLTNKKFKRLLAILLQFSLPLLINVSAQTTVEGHVTDAYTLEPVVFANVLFQDTHKGTITDFNGFFSISGKPDNDSLIISFVGYETKTIKIRKDTFQVLDIQLNPATYALDEVVIRPGENPAHIILRKVWANKKYNHIEKLSAYEYENYSRSTVFLRKFGYKSDNEFFFKPFAKAFSENAVSTGEEAIPALPSYITESLSDVYYLSSPKREYTYIKAVNAKGLAFDNTGMVSQLVKKQENFYFLDNTVSLMDKSFISPLSRAGLLYYKYYLIDSGFIDNKYYCYEIKIVPRREEDPVFRGTMWIHDTTYALKRISLEVNRKAEINFIQRIKIQQDYEPVDSGVWFAIKTRFMADAANIFVINFSEKSKIMVNQFHNPGFYASDIKVSNKALDYNDDFWDKKRENSYEKIDSLAVQRINTLKKSKGIRVTALLVEAAIKGYYNLGRFEAGPYLMLYNYNDVEGSRLRFGGRTNIDFSNQWILEGYLAYGMRDASYKGSIQAAYFLSKERWNKIGVQFRDDLENTGAIDEFYTQNSFLTFATTFGGSDKMARSRIWRVWTETDLLRDLNVKAVATNKTFQPVSPDFHFAYFKNNEKTILADKYIISELAFIVRYQPKVSYVLDGNRRFPVNFNKSPVLSLEYYKGFKNFFKSDFNYHKISAGIYHNFTTGVAGTMIYDISFTKVFSALPFPLLITLAGNQSFFRANRTYNLMNYGEFIIDEAFEFFYAWHMDGLILNRLPIIRKLDWRTVVTVHAAFGNFDEKHNGYFNSESNPEGILSDISIDGYPATQFNSLTYSKPYAELSYGIENIFKFFRVDLIQRLTYLDHPGVHQFAVKISGVFRF